MLIDEMMMAYQEGSLGIGENREWLELHRWQIMNAIDDLELTHSTWTDLDAKRMDLLIRTKEYFTALINISRNERISSGSDQKFLSWNRLGFSGFGGSASVQYSDAGTKGYSGLD